MKQETNAKQQSQPDPARRSLIGRLAAALFGARLTAAAHAPSTPAACPVDLGGVRPDELTYADALSTVLNIEGLGDWRDGGSLFALLWRFRTLSDGEAADWLTRLHAETRRREAIYDAQVAAIYAKGGVL
jgi:hypothetical protein